MQQQSYKQDSLINRIVQAMRETLVLDDVLQTTVNLLHETLQVSRCLIFQPDPNNQMRVRHVSEATEKGRSLMGIYCDFYEYYHQMLMQAEPVVIARIDANIPRELQELARSCEIRSLLIMPLLYHESYLGGISLNQCDREREWTDTEITLVRAIATQCAIAIHQAQLFNQVQQQATRERLLNQIGRSLNSSLDPDSILQEIVKLAGECFGVDRVTIFAIKAEHTEIVKEWRANEQVISVVGYRVPLIEHRDLLDPTSNYSFHRVVHAPKTSLMAYTAERQMQVQQAQMLSMLRVPIFIRGELFGGISLQTTTTYRTFTQDEIQFLERIADQAAIALYNAQSYELLEQLVRERTRELEQEKIISESANRAKSEFLTTMSHELRTPLTGILGFSRLLLEQIFGPLNEKQLQYMANINSCGEHLLALINDLLDLSKIEAGREELFLEILSVEDISSAALQVVAERAYEGGLQLSMEIAPNVTVCVADQRRLKQILVNLLSNAVKFTPIGSVTLKVNQTEDTVHFSVIDTGIGIAEADLANLFQPFRQLDSGLNRKYEGSGLGLALSCKLAKLHGGNITVESELGRGSCFTLHLPIQPPTESEMSLNSLT
ncbi:GAF domain-containing protein [Microcoleus sp. FACHB-831]|uniref:sensor histidine kinase n=1 Tax=Microcoleus sp. FACHB-831 TaxID=2692827 RepID=UPI001683ABE7|nr:GAF domain-containing protein [Microcoleus sp. FACHB-831]MBD1923582.1 GAF domain-containing protein [Microcoleus sp. FACHB-831]